MCVCVVGLVEAMLYRVDITLVHVVFALSSILTPYPHTQCLIPDANFDKGKIKFTIIITSRTCVDVLLSFPLFHLYRW